LVFAKLLCHKLLVSLSTCKGTAGLLIIDPLLQVVSDSTPWIFSMVGKAIAVFLERLTRVEATAVFRYIYSGARFFLYKIIIIIIDFIEFISILHLSYPPYLILGIASRTLSTRASSISPSCGLLFASGSRFRCLPASTRCPTCC
jgi:hypothetical protein